MRSPLIQLLTDLQQLIWHHLAPNDLLSVAQMCREFNVHLKETKVMDLSTGTHRSTGASNRLG